MRNFLLNLFKGRRVEETPFRGPKDFFSYRNFSFLEEEIIRSRQLDYLLKMDHAPSIPPTERHQSFTTSIHLIEQALNALKIGREQVMSYRRFRQAIHEHQPFLDEPYYERLQKQMTNGITLLDLRKQEWEEQRAALPTHSEAANPSAFLAVASVRNFLNVGELEKAVEVPLDVDDMNPLFQHRNLFRQHMAEWEEKWQEGQLKEYEYLLGRVDLAYRYLQLIDAYQEYLIDRKNIRKMA